MKSYDTDKARGLRLQQRRNELGLSQTEVARRMGKKTHVPISRWEAGDSITDKSLEALAEALESSHKKDWFIYGDKGPSLPQATVEAISASLRVATRILLAREIDIDSDAGQRFINAVIRQASESGPVSEAALREWVAAAIGKNPSDK